MSTAPSTLTRPERPPYRGGPPVKTTFDGWFSGDQEPDYETYLESADKLLKVLDANPSEDFLPVMLRLLKQRQSWLQEQLWAMRALEPTSLPPIKGFEMFDLFEPADSLEMRLVRMLDRLSDAIYKVEMRLNMQNPPFPLSDP